MSSPIQLSFPCSICGYLIRGEYEEEDFQYPVFCPKCGRQNALPSPATRIDSSPADAVQQVVHVIPASVEPPVHITVPVEPAESGSNPPPVQPSRQNAPSRARSATVSPAPPSRPSRPSRVAWRFRPEFGHSPVVGLRNCATVDDQGRVIAAIGNTLYAIVPHSTSCDVAWKFSAADLIPGSPVIGNVGVIFAHSSDGLLHALDAAGHPLRTPTRIGPALGWATPLVDGANCVWASSATGGIVKVDASGQTTPRPFLRSPSRFDCTGAIHQNVLYIGSEDQFLHAIDLAGDRGRDLWIQRDKVGLTGWYINSAIAIADDGRIIAISRDDSLYAFEPDGTVAWMLALNGRAFGSPVMTTDGLVIVGLTTRTGDSVSGRLVAIEHASGRQKWSLDFESPIESTAVVGNAGEIYVGDNSGQIHAVSLTGSIVWSEQVGVGEPASPDSDKPETYPTDHQRANDDPILNPSCDAREPATPAVRSGGNILPTGQVVFGLDDGSLVAVRCDSTQIAGSWPKLLGTATNRCPLS